MTWHAPAVIQRRHEPPDSLDYFPTPPWATRAFVAHVLGGLALRDALIWEPACGEGHMAATLRETFRDVVASDVFAYGYGLELDFLDPLAEGPKADWIITNPPFNAAVDFAKLALARARDGVALLVRTNWLHGVERSRFFETHPPAVVALYSERVPMHRGRWVPDGSTATEYCWVVWPSRIEARSTDLVWIPPGCRKLLTRPDDALRFGAKLPDGGLLP
jgi:hypothetical protein